MTKAKGPNPTDDPRTGRLSPKPRVIWHPSAKHSSRNGVWIDTIVLHYTNSLTTQSALDTLTVGTRQASAHYVIGKDGACYQLVKDSDKAWHCKSFNARSIGIEHVAVPGERMTAAQEAMSVSLIRYLLEEYHIPVKRLFGHRHTGQSTLCPGALFGPLGSQQEIEAWATKHFGYNFSGGKDV